MSMSLKKLLRLLISSRHHSRVWQRHSALLKQASKQPGRVGL